MGFRKLVGLVGLLSLFGSFSGCSKDEAQRVQPESRGQRGEACQARNDCQGGLACINGTCSRNDFDIEVSAKHCDQIDCTTDNDCCGDLPTEAPAACANRISVCQTPTLPGCIATSCTSDAACGGGICGSGSCDNTFAACTSDATCVDTCVAGICQESFLDCSVTPCPVGSCTNRFCGCANPQYNPLDPICSNPACTNLCTLKCEEELCVPDTSCDEDTDCFGGVGNICSAAGRCVECEVESDCAVDSGQSCVQGVCKKPCEKNEECPLFQACQGGECVETGCTSDRECVLAANDVGGGGAEDGRLLKCLQDELNPMLKVCKVPCENDGACGSQFQVCDAGFCKFVGCSTNEECRSYLGLERQMTTPTHPYISTAICRD